VSANDRRDVASHDTPVLSDEIPLPVANDSCHRCRDFKFALEHDSTAQYALNVQYAPAAAIPNQVMVGSSKAAR
jgi:hypothetical protein